MLKLLESAEPTDIVRLRCCALESGGACIVGRLLDALPAVRLGVGGAPAAGRLLELVGVLCAPGVSPCDLRRLLVLLAAARAGHSLLGAACLRALDRMLRCPPAAAIGGGGLGRCPATFFDFGGHEAG